jgi:hypothetical protein
MASFMLAQHKTSQSKLFPIAGFPNARQWTPPFKHVAGKGCMHIKLVCLTYRDGRVRIAIPTANSTLQFSLEPSLMTLPVKQYEWDAIEFVSALRGFCDGSDGVQKCRSQRSSWLSPSENDVVAHRPATTALTSLSHQGARIGLSRHLEAHFPTPGRFAHLVPIPEDGQFRPRRSERLPGGQHGRLPSSRLARIRELRHCASDRCIRPSSLLG